MKLQKLISLGIFFAYSILFLGIIHNVATFTPLIQAGLACLEKESFQAMIYMSLVCGTSFILSGIVIIMLIRHVNKFQIIGSVLIVIGIFLALSGILSVIYMFENPFAWLALILNIGMFVIILAIKKTMALVNY